MCRYTFENVAIEGDKLRNVAIYGNGFKYKAIYGNRPRNLAMF